VLKVTANPKFGNILSDGEGYTLYYFDDPTSAAGKDPMKCTNGPTLGRGGGKVNTCLSAWPALVSAEVPGTPAGATGKLALVSRADFNNVKQVTYNDAPLYYFLGDKAPGDATGDGVKAFAANWQVVKAG